MRTIRSPIIAVGGALVVLGGLGLLHLARHAPAPRCAEPCAERCGRVHRCGRRPTAAIDACHLGRNPRPAGRRRRRAARDDPHHHPHRGRTCLGRRRQSCPSPSIGAVSAALPPGLTDLRGRQPVARRAKPEPDRRCEEADVRRARGRRTSAPTTRTPISRRPRQAQGQGADRPAAGGSTVRPSSWPSTSAPVRSRRPGSCRRPSCSTAPAPSRSTASRSRTPAVASSTPSPSTASRPASSA